MAKSKVAKKFHLDPDGYLTTKPDRQLTTEEEATDAAEAAIGVALEEGGAIAEAIAASSGGGGSMVIHSTTSASTTGGTDLWHYDTPFSEIEEQIKNGNYDIKFIVHPTSQAAFVSDLSWYAGDESGNITTIFFTCISTMFSGTKPDFHTVQISKNNDYCVTHDGTL